jgi:tetratricopeptide (TPR) repeat protein
MGRSVIANSISLDSCGVEMLAGDPAAAERELRRDYEALSAMGERYVLSTVAVELARAVAAQGRQEEALGLTRVAEELSADDDITSQALWRVVRGTILAQQGKSEEALSLASAGLDLLRRTDASVVRDEGLVEVAEVMRVCGDPDAALELLREALGLLERKGNVAKAAAVRPALEALDPSTASV